MQHQRQPLPLQHLLLLAAAVCLLLPHHADAARLLVVPLASSSHIAAFTALTTALEQHGGHEIHMVVLHEFVEPAGAMAAARNASHGHSYLSYALKYELFPQDMADMAKANSIRAMAIGYKVLAAMTDMVIGDKQLLQEISALQPDLIIGDATASFGHWLTALTGVPSIEFDVGTSSALLHSMHGGQSNPAYLPAPGTFYPSTGMTLRQRCINTAATAAVRAMAHFHGDFGPIRALADRRGVKHLPGTGPHKPLLLLVNYDWALEPARPTSPSIKYLGALMPREPQPLPDDIQGWLDASRDKPVTYLSFGASFTAPEAAVPAVASATAAALSHMRFILSMKQPEQQLLKAAWQRLGVQPSEEVLLREWLPQNDLLGCGRIAVFVTQGGYLSMQEAAYHSVPVIAVPLSLGQEEISQFAEDQGRGLVVRKETLLAGQHQPLLQALMKVVVANSTGFKAQARLVAARLKAHPRSPGEQAADWVAYALASPRGSGSFLHTQGQDCHWWQIMLLDVAAVYAAALAAAGVALRSAYRLLKRPAGPKVSQLHTRAQAEGPGTPSPPQSPVHSSAGYKATKAD